MTELEQGALGSSEPLLQLKELCSNHDWYYDYSDDHSVWKKGNESWKSIESLYYKCVWAGQELEALNIINRASKF